MTRRSASRLALCTILLVSATACADDEPVASPADGWVTVTDQPSGAQIALPEGAQPSADTATDANGSQVTLRHYAATAAAGAVEVGFRHDALDVEVSYGTDNVVLFLVDADEHVLQPLVAGPESRRAVVEKTFEQLTESLDAS
jgi:hypothetical protein